jgi:hypothetical protein
MSEEKSIEVWYRGEGVGVPPARPGGHLHDFGDGLYFSDTIEVAEVYARRRADALKNQRVYLVAFPQAKLGPVLDLTKDLRWSEFMLDRSDKNLLGKSRREYLAIKQELYGQFFQEFLAKHKINILDYNAVIGPEYNLGGKQLAILHKNGRPTSLQGTFRSMFRPALLIHARYAAVAKLLPSAVSGKIGKVIPFRLSNVATKGLRRVSVPSKRILPGAGAAGVGLAIVVNILVDIVLMLLLSRFAKTAQDWLEEELAKLEPDVNRQVQDQVLWAAQLIVDGSEAYANFTMHLETRTVGDESHGPYLKPKRVEAVITANKKEEEVDVSRPHGIVEASWGHTLVTKRHVVSSKIDIPSTVIEVYKSIVNELEWYAKTLLEQESLGDYKTISAEELNAFRTERDELIGLLGGVFGVNKVIADKHVGALFL